MASAGAILAGRAAVIITANDTPFQQGLKRVQNRMVALKAVLLSVGSQLAIGGAGMGYPMLRAAQSAATFEDALLGLKASVADITPNQLRKVREESLRLSKSLGATPTAIAQSFELLIKAGMSVEDALSGAAKSAVEFAAISGVAAQDAATFMKVAMNVWGISAQEAANTLSAAADSSETSIRAMIESFSLVASVAKGTNQSLFGLSQGIALLARYGIQGEEAGTGIKTLLVKLLSPTQDAREALATLGLSMESFVDKTGKLLPLVQIAKLFSDRMKGMDKSARDAMLTNEALVKVFDVRGIRVIQAFADAGEKGFADMADAMESSRTVSEKYAIAMSGIAGAFKRLYAAAERLAISFSTSVALSFASATESLVWLIDAVSSFIDKHPGVATAAAAIAAGALAIGTVAIVAAAAIAPVTMLTTAVTALATAMQVLNANPVSLAILALAAAFGVGTLIGHAMFDKPKQKQPKGKAGDGKNRPRRPGPEEPLSEPGAAAQEGKVARLGAATFSGVAAGQLGIGPAIDPIRETAKNTAKMAVLMNGMQNAVEAKVATTDRSLVDPAEKTAAGIDTLVSLTRQLVANNNGLEFA